MSDVEIQMPTKLTQVVALPPMFSVAKSYRVPLTYVTKNATF